MARLTPGDLANRYVGLLFLAQVVGWIVLLATVDHASTTLTAWVQSIPGAVRLLLLPFAILAIPAIGITLLLGFLLDLLGVPPESLPALLLTEGDVLGLSCMYALGVGGAWWVRHRKWVGVRGRRSVRSKGKSQ